MIRSCAPTGTAEAGVVAGGPETVLGAGAGAGGVRWQASAAAETISNSERRILYMIQNRDTGCALPSCASPAASFASTHERKTVDHRHRRRIGIRQVHRREKRAPGARSRLHVCHRHGWLLP